MTLVLLIDCGIISFVIILSGHTQHIYQCTVGSYSIPAGGVRAKVKLGETCSKIQLLNSKQLVGVHCDESGYR